MKVVLIAICLVFALLRIVLPTEGFRPSDVFKDLAHVFVGGLFGAALATRRRDLWGMAIGLTILEVVVAMIK